ncbi:lactose/L-arabinose transport system substrate-binding protein [Evansella caseinilytica]|uniref:Lactose/L-arabinose transport system substrate-binding protein n=1 Tax=Evansella caseinilytica TaxID=1503961 RepID=A0A1H3T6J5_9BACI|nr:ABC transporter substrate-binding protein [Evansella caseinilytica]SDZ45335.1 lactose/L-arabinose transport system substrate-binding protein [Evansella caseinilytica]
MKKLIFMLFFLSIVLLAACSGGDSDSAKETTDGSGGDEGADSEEAITIWAWDPNFNMKAMELAKEKYAADNPDLEINLVEYAQDDIIQKLNTSLSSGSTSGLPNIVLIEDYRAQSFLQAYPGSFHPITGAYSTDDFASYKIAPTSLDGENYGLPFDTGVVGLYVRTDYLAEAGYSIEDLQNIDWNKYIEIARDVKDATGKHMLTVDPNDLGLIRMMIQTTGTWYVEEDGATPNIADNEAIKAGFEVFKELITEDLAKPVSDWSQFLAGFNNGDVASVPTGNWITPSIKAEESQAGQWAVVPFPSLPGFADSINATNLGGSSWYVLDVDGKEAATDFLTKTFGSNTELYQDFITEIGAMGTYLPASEGDAYQVEDEFFGGQTIYADFSHWAEEIPQVNFGLHTYAIEDILVVEMQNYLNGKEVDQALADAQTQAEAQIK